MPIDPKASRSRYITQETPLRVSAIVVVGDAAPLLEPCIRQVLAEQWVDELILIDAGATKAMASSLRGLQADRRDVKFLQNRSAPLNHAAARNLGAERAQGRWLLFVDPDVVLQKGAVERMVKAGRLARSPWIVGGGLSDPSGRRRAVPGRSFIARRPTPVEAIDEALALIPRAEFFSLGGFDETFSLHGETADLCKRARDNGGAVWLQPVAEGVQFAAARAASPIDDQIARARAAAHYARKYARTDFARHAVTVWGPLLIAFNAAKGAAMAPFKSLRKDTVLRS